MSEDNCMSMLSKLIRENGFSAAPTKTERHTPHIECLIAIGNDHTASIIMDEDALEELYKLTGIE